MTSDTEPPSKKQKQTEEIKFNMSRLKQLHGAKGAPTNVTGVAYYMHRDQRVQDNWAMIYAQSIASRHNAPLHVVSLITTIHPTEPGATLRHLSFCFDGLKEVSEELSDLNIPFHLLIGQGESDGKIAEWMKQCDVNCLITDFSPLRQHRGIVNQLTSALADNTTVYQVDAHNIVPVEVTSEKQEYAARTIRKKITSQLGKFLTEFPKVTRHAFGDASTTTRYFADKTGLSKDLKEDWDSVLQSLKLDFSVKPSELFQGGTKAGLACLEAFVKKRIKIYTDKRNDPTEDALSNLSPWFHMGNLSVQRAVLYVKKHASSHSASFVEESVVRRELSDNFCYYNPHYDSVKGASKWAQDTLETHKKDKREFVYTRKEFEEAKTHDNLWNAAQRQLVKEGKMHGFMRMYWAKKILEWTESPEQALEEALFLNDHFSLDGNDANGFVGCMWSICGIHDQGWGERAVFGKIRFMNYNGCKRKFNIEKYIAKYNNYKEKK